ncbi:BnaC09g31470D [Brassica napus]|uniref:BnaC09g31470D protein n=1 Tax=Brassica napus TaxID=3708 RepID=A0A078G3F1_BRANA|nr:BnaC09g31470D [Brassica napus]
MDRGIYERLKTMERNICCHLGVSPPNVHNTLKMKADDDNHGLSDSPKTVGIQKQWPPRKSRRASSTVTKPTKKIHSYPLRSADGLQGNIGRTPPYFNKESGADYDCAHDRTPPFDEHVNYQEPCTPYAVPDESNSENPVTTVTVYNPLIFVRPQSYVSPTKLQEEQPGAVETLPGSDTDEDGNSVESGDKLLRKKSQKICGVYTPDARQFQIKTSHIVTNFFFLDIATPGKWLSDEKDRMVMFDPYFTKFITSNWLAFNEVEDKLDFDWGTNIAAYITGKSRGKNLKLELGRDVDMVYTPMHWGRNHWVGLCINLRTSNVTILDSFITENRTEADVDVQMTPVLKSLPYILEQYVEYTVYQISEGVRFYSWNRVEGIYHNKRGGDCAPCAAEFMEMHSNGVGKEEMRLITDKVVDKFREQYVMDCYEEFFGDYQVANEASMK